MFGSPNMDTIDQALNRIREKSGVTMEFKMLLRLCAIFKLRGAKLGGFVDIDSPNFQDWFQYRMSVIKFYLKKDGADNEELCELFNLLEIAEQHP